jgi:hypothetical protein
MTARNTQPGEMDVISRSARRVQSLVAACLGAVAVLLWQHIPTAPAAQPVEDTGLVAACRLPSADGEMTVFIVEGGKMKCWRWK